MKIFAIADLHLPGGDDKPMDVFGEHWDHHFERISADWREKVTGEDTVLIAGDISWAMQLRNAVPDLEAIAALPGQKVLIKGNHDYWWASMTQVRDVLPAGMLALQHTAVDIGPAVICGTRGWVFPTGEEALSAEDEKIYKRELARLEMALQAARKLSADKPLLAMTHYPPLYDQCRDTAFTALMERYGVSWAIYGHLHGAGIKAGYTGAHNGVQYVLTSCDALGFQVKEISAD